MRRSCLAFLVPSLVLALLAACGGSSGNPIGQPCTQAGDCESQSCAPQGLCTASCQASTDCPDGFTCGTNSDGRRLCLAACDGGYLPPGVVCVDHAQVACEQAGEHATCDACGCPDGQRCNEATMCVPLAAVGEPCTAHAECASYNCGISDGSPTGRCLVARGAPCNGTNCLSCNPTVDGDVCAESCQSTADCGSNETCMGYQGDGFYSCFQNCDTMRCPDYWACRPTGGIPYCEPPQRCDPNVQFSCGPNGTCDPEHGFCH
jgi:hypothetical protein